MAVRIIQPEFLLALPKWDDRKVEPLPQICVAGRSNVGKSSLINALVAQTGLAKTSSTPGRTQSLIVFGAKIRSGEETLPFLLVDLPGYGYAKVPMSIKQGWRPMMSSYFEGNDKIKVCLFLVDIRRTPKDEELELLELLSESGIPAIPILTKIDKVPKTQRAREVKKVAAALDLEPEDLRLTSVAEKMGIDDVREELFDLIKGES